MTPQDIQTIHELLANRVQPHSAREGAAILQLAAKLVSHFAPKPAPPQDSQQPTAPADK
jgi:hypothetical protein